MSSFLNLIFFFLNLVDTELAIMENTPAPQVEVEQEANESTATPPQDVHDNGNLPILC